ncbi:hypothetical protein SNE40_009672 [Patella caerulea]|uniref:Uncharacterized protein n=1 Tax=Patella caerulea TaxID=87958 RepID=A0AAN8JZ37_PATCE
MEVDLAAWRMIIGMYHHKTVTRKINTKFVRVQSLTISIIMVLSLLMILCGNVESNPGPTNTRQGTLSKTGEVVYPEKENVGHDLMTMFQSLKSDIAELKNQVNELNIKEEVIEIKKDVKELKTANEKLNKRMDNFENRARQNNLFFYGLEEFGDLETKEDSDKLIREVLKGEVKIERADDKSEVKFERIYR